ncbi:MAG TPA: PilZ domain-containing protein [Polyangia bacterium]|jgi:uncharacterized protein (TIGR02266 family)|nr:PilZ domain-containing protein [Polyangia bacterium]HWE27382.1 PilZ domain-containing protein [Polyangia bacterium]
MSAGASRSNLRQHKRSPLELPIIVSDAANKVEAHIEFNTQDLSVGGAFIRSDLLFEVGEELQLDFALPDGRTVQARGKVVRVARDSGDDVIPGMGIQFVALSDADRESIRALCTRGSNG